MTAEPQAQPDPVDDTAGSTARDELRKAAVLLLALGGDAAAKLLSQLDREQVQTLSAQVVRLGPVSLQERLAVLQEFHEAVTIKRYESGGTSFLRSLLERSRRPEEAEQILHEVQPEVQRAPFEFLRRIDPRNLLTFVREEHPQTIALILAHLPPRRAAEVLRELPAETQVDVTSRIASMGDTTPDAVEQVEQGVAARLADLVDQDLKRTGDPATAAEILNRVDRQTERSILQGLQDQQGPLADSIRRHMFVFEDIIRVDDRGLQEVIRYFAPEDWALALKTASPEVKEKVYKNLTDRAVATIEDEIEYLGVVRLRDVEATQQRIVDVVRRLEEDGQLIIEGRSESEPMVG